MTRQNETFHSKPVLMVTTLTIMLAVGLIDYLSGYEMYFSVFYLLAVCFAVWFVGKGFGVMVSVLSVAIWLVGDLVAGARYSSSLVPWWNAAIIMCFYSVVVWLLASLRTMHRELEEKVQRRTAALTSVIAERERLEKEILNISEREQRRIGYDLHDSLCQHLTGVALAGQVLSEKLAAKGQSEAGDANRVVELVEEGIALARNLASGLQPVEIEGDGLVASFRELACGTKERFKVECDFLCTEPVVVDDVASATHLYRIAQEAIGNAVRHGKPKRIVLKLTALNDEVTLTVRDDGVGLSESVEEMKGMGLRIMKHRAAMIGASFDVRRGPAGGTIVTCSFRNGLAEDERKATDLLG